MSDSFATPRTVACQAPLSMGFLRQEYLSGLPFPSPGNLPISGIELASPALVGGYMCVCVCVCVTHFFIYCKQIYWACSFVFLFNNLHMLIMKYLMKECSAGIKLSHLNDYMQLQIK